MEDNEQFDVFISYRRRQSLKVESIYTELIKEYKVFFDQGSIRTGAEYEKKIFSAIKNTKCLLIVLTKESCEEFNEKKNNNEIDWVVEELSYAQKMDIPILPIVLYDEKYYNDVEVMITSLEECVPAKIKSFFPKLQLFKVRLDYRTRMSDIDTLKKEIEDYAVKRKVIKSIKEQKNENFEKNQNNKIKIVRNFFFVLLSIVIFGLIFWVYFWDKEQKISIKDVKLDTRVYMVKENVEKIISNPIYLEYKMWKYGGFDFRAIYYHEKRILPKEYKAKIQGEIQGYISFLNTKIEDAKNNMSRLSRLDDIEIATLFFKSLSEDTFSQELSVDEQKTKLKEFFSNEILSIKRIINNLKDNPMIENRSVLRIKVLNNDAGDRLLKNSIQAKYKNDTFTLARTKQPISHKKLHAIPVSSGDTPEESYEREDFKVVPKGSIVELWYSFEKNVKLCAAGGSYKVILYSKATESISKIIKCKEKE